jgi:hypothetical protein
MKYTLLEMTQQILRSMSGDEVTSITDTAESEAIAHIIKENFFNITGLMDLPEHYDLFELVATNSTTKTLMTRPTDVLGITWIKYNHIDTGETNNNYQMIEWLDLDTFLYRMESLNVDADNIATYSLTIGTSTFDVKYLNDKQPQYYTTWDDNYILFDSIDIAVDTSNLVANKTLAYGHKAPTFSLTDGATPDLDATQFQLLLNESKSQAFLELRQQANPKAEQKVKDNKIKSQQNKRAITNPYDEYRRAPNYGRRGPTPGGAMTKAMRSGS